MLYAGDGGVITGLAALRCHHIRGPSADFIDVLVPATRQRRDTGFVRLHRTTRMPEAIWQAGPLRYAPPARAVADAVREMTSLRDVRAVVADAVQRNRCKIKDLYAELVAGASTGSVLFREALTDVADGIRSTAEADLKDLLVRSRLPMPLFNASVYKGDTFIAKPDAWWPELGVAAEVESHEWHMSPEDHAGTLARSRRMGRAQMVVLSFTPKQIRSEPTAVIEEIRGTLEGARGRSPLNLRTVPASENGQLALPAKPQPAKPQPARSQPARSQPARSQPARSQPARSQPARSQPAKPQPAKPQPAKPQPAKPQPAKPQPAKPQPARSQPAKPVS